jgi:asparagine synthase (glutamine-hydrolysing)
VRDARGAVQHAMYEAVRKRVLNTDRPIACLLSGGLDSSIVASMVQRCRVELGRMDPLETYSIGMEGSEDLRHAALMAVHLGSQHTSIVLSEAEFFNAIPEVVRAIESYDTTTVRASVGNYLVAKYIREHSDAKVIFNGDGADELAGGYLYFHYAPDVAARDAECKRLLRDIHCFDALRSDKCIASNGLEARTPFLDRAFVQTYLAIPMEERFPQNAQEKLLLRQAFYNYLPETIVHRRKEAFSDGVSGQRPWFETIQCLLNMDPNLAVEFANYSTPINPPKTVEQYYYRRIFDACYQGAATIPYFWMPRFVDSDDCSARTLSIYKN